MSTSNELERNKRGLTNVPVEDFILRRWSPRAFADTPVSSEDLKTVFTAASWSASSYNEQPWRFLVGRKDDESWNKIYHALLPMNQEWAKTVPVLYAAIAKKVFSHNGAANRVAVHDVGAACATLSLQAILLGLHTHGMAGFDPEKLRESFGIPSEYDAVSCWALGYLGDPDTLSEKYRSMEVQARTRKPLSDFVFSAWEQPASL